MKAWLIRFFAGRHTLFLTVNLVAGITLAWYHRLDSNLVTLLLGLQSMVLAHSVKEDHYSTGPNGGGQ